MASHPVRKNALQVASSAEYVSIDQEVIRRIAKRWSLHALQLPSWPRNFLDSDDEQQLINFQILLHCLLYQVWSKHTPWHVIHGRERLYGYDGIAFALARFFREFPGKANFSYFSNIPLGEFKAILSGRGRLHSIDTRWITVRKVSLRLLNEYEGDGRLLVHAAKGRVKKLVEKIAHELYSFNDACYFRKKKLQFFCRAQRLASSIIGIFDGTGVGKFNDRDFLTARADAQLSQLLAHMGILVYAPDLEKKILRRSLIAMGSQEEIEIRSSTLIAVEFLRRELEKKRRNIKAYELDIFLRRKFVNKKVKIPQHLTETTFY